MAGPTVKSTAVISWPCEQQHMAIDSQRDPFWYSNTGNERRQIFHMLSMCVCVYTSDVVVVVAVAATAGSRNLLSLDPFSLTDIVDLRGTSQRMPTPLSPLSPLSLSLSSFSSLSLSSL